MGLAGWRSYIRPDPTEGGEEQGGFQGRAVPSLGGAVIQAPPPARLFRVPMASCHVQPGCPPTCEHETACRCTQPRGSSRPGTRSQPTRPAHHLHVHRGLQQLRVGRGGAGVVAQLLQQRLWGGGGGPAGRRWVMTPHRATTLYAQNRRGMGWGARSCTGGRARACPSCWTWCPPRTRARAKQARPWAAAATTDRCMPHEPHGAAQHTHLPLRLALIRRQLDRALGEVGLAIVKEDLHSPAEG
jgi:hypothetical protein